MKRFYWKSKTSRAIVEGFAMHPGPSQEDRQHSEPSFEESSEESTSEAESDSSSESTERKISHKKKKANKIPDKDYLSSFRDILAFAEESEYFLAPRALRVEAKPQLFAPPPPTEARQAATQFTSPLVKFLFESVFSVGFFGHIIISSADALCHPSSNRPYQPDFEPLRLHG